MNAPVIANTPIIARVLTVEMLAAFLVLVGEALDPMLVPEVPDPAFVLEPLG